MNSGGQYAGRCGNDGQSIIVQITDSCPECGANQFDIQALTYSKVGGRVWLFSRSLLVLHAR